jgi:hypothetical protein
MELSNLRMQKLGDYGQKLSLHRPVIPSLCHKRFVEPFVFDQVLGALPRNDR